MKKSKGKKKINKYAVIGEIRKKRKELTLAEVFEKLKNDEEYDRMLGKFQHNKKFE